MRYAIAALLALSLAGCLGSAPEPLCDVGAFEPSCSALEPSPDHRWVAVCPEADGSWGVECHRTWHGLGLLPLCSDEGVPTCGDTDVVSICVEVPYSCRGTYQGP